MNSFSVLQKKLQYKENLANLQLQCYLTTQGVVGLISKYNMDMSYFSCELLI